MYHYVTDKEFIAQMRQFGGELLQDLSHNLKEDYNMGTTFFLVGSGKRKLIMQNGNKPIDLDYNLKIVRCKDYYDYKNIKPNIITAFNKVLRNYSLPNCNDSTSVITTKEIYFTKGNPTKFKIDIAIIAENKNGTYNRLIHEKTGFTNLDRYYWVPSPNSRNINEKADYIKKNGKWVNVCEQYERIKNKYLTQNDYNHPSFICYIEAINNVYNSRGHW